MASVCCTHLKDNIHMVDFPDDSIPKAVGDLLDIDFNQKFRTQADIKNILARVKNPSVAQ